MKPCIETNMDNTGGYHQSLKARPRRDGLCCRPGCNEPIWTGNKGEISAYCSVQCANQFSLGFKKEDGGNGKGDILAPTVLFDEYIGALNTSPSVAALYKLHEELADSMVHFCFDATQVYQLRQAYTERLHELVDDGHPKKRQPATGVVEPDSGHSFDRSILNSLTNDEEEDLVKSYDTEVEYFLAAGAEGPITVSVNPADKLSTVAAQNVHNMALNIAKEKVKQGKISKKEYSHICQVNARSQNTDT
eukprot:m.94270 g.94270  ORF g.94270 m.94270 type:complete len:248 (+) comp13435_c1_seq4:332-1075(+)